MNRILNILCLTLLINTNVYASNEDRIKELHSDNTKTHFDLRNIMKDASFSYENNDKVIAKYNRILFFIDLQKALSIVNLELNNKLSLGKAEKNLISQMNDIRANSKQIKMLNLKYSDNQYKMITQYFFEHYEIPFSLYYDVREILKNDKVKNHDDQLKLDIYRQVQDMKNNSIKYNEEFKVLHMYFINQFYEKTKLALAYTNDGIVKELEITNKNSTPRHLKENMSSSDKEKASKIKDKIKYETINILKYATFTNKNQKTKPNKTNFNIIFQDKNDIPEEDHKNLNDEDSCYDMDAIEKLVLGTSSGKNKSKYLPRYINRRKEQILTIANDNVLVKDSKLQKNSKLIIDKKNNNIELNNIDAYDNVKIINNSSDKTFTCTGIHAKGPNVFIDSSQDNKPDDTMKVDPVYIHKERSHDLENYYISKYGNPNNETKQKYFPRHTNVVPTHTQYTNNKVHKVAKLELA